MTVDPVVHAAEIARFDGHVVCGPMASDCDFWACAIGADGYGRFYLTRDGVGFCVRPHRSALAVAGCSVAAGVLGLHECDDRCARRSLMRQRFSGMSCPAPRATT